jgi:thiol-disulfide isomerase/thioredoxin
MKYTFACIVFMFMQSNIDAANDPISTTLETYNEAHLFMRQNNAAGFIVFTAQWCQPCKKFHNETIAPLLPQLKQKYVVYTVDVTNPDTVDSQQWRNYKMLDYLPSYAILSRGGDYILGWNSGFKTQEELIAWMNEVVNKYK